MQHLTRTLARYVCASRPENLTPAIMHEGLRAFVNFVGCAAGGAYEDDVEIMLRFLREYDGAAEAVVIGRPERLDILNAAFVNSMSSSALAFNDTHTVSVAHPTSPVAAALLALAQRRELSGRELLHALVLGIEIQCRVGNILTVAPAQCQVGLSMQGLVGPIGAAVAAAKVLGLDETTTAMTLGLAANQSCGLRQAQSTMGSHFTPGNAARAGLMAALLAERGFNCTDQVLEGPKGFAVSYGTQPNYESAVAGLGENWEISTLSYKPYPSGFVINPIIDACLEIAAAHAFDHAAIQRVELVVNPLTVKLTNLVDPADRGQALVSLQHWTAVSLAHKAAGTAQLTEDVVRDPVIAALRRRVSFKSDDRLGVEAATARVVLDDGRTLDAHVACCRGSATRPLTDADITTKTVEQLATVFGAQRAQGLADATWRVGTLGRINDYLASLAGAAAR